MLNTQYAETLTLYILELVFFLHLQFTWIGQIWSYFWFWKGTSELFNKNYNYTNPVKISQI